MSVDCFSCKHLRKAPYQVVRTGCFHPDHMKVRYTEAFLDEQQLGGDYRKLNLRGDCSKYDPLPKKQCIIKRIFSNGTI